MQIIRLVAMLACAAVMAWIGHFIWTTAIRGGRLAHLMPYVLVLIASAGIFILLQHVFRLRLMIAPAELAVSPDRFGVGTDVAVNWRQPFLSHVRVNRSALRLVFSEEATEGGGKNARYYEEETEIHRVDRGKTDFQAGDELVMSLRARIPDDAMHSFKTESNKLEWRVEAILDVPGWPGLKETRILTVAPRREG
jgi:hypothetical protein